MRCPRPKPHNFRDWIDANFGPGIAEIFLLPYNFKTWAFPADHLSSVWVGERVAGTDLGRVLHNLVFDKDDVSWGPNSTFQFPKLGGTGAIWRACASDLPQDKLFLSEKITKIDLKRREVFTSNGAKYKYETLISTIPLNKLVRLTGQDHLEPLAEGLLHSSSHIIGLGLRGQPHPELRKKCWMYFPEADCPFYRVTVFSNYSPNNVPDSSRHWSLMCEVSESAYKPVDEALLLDDVIQGALNTRLINDRNQIIDEWKYRAEYGYPIPGVHRDEALDEIIPFFESITSIRVVASACGSTRLAIRTTASCRASR